MSTTFWQFTLFGILGIFGEVVLTALKDLVRTRRFRLHGCSFIWMFPIYGLIALLFPVVSSRISGQAWFVRGILYMLLIYAVEFITGTILTAITGGPIWQYTGRFQYKGLIHFLYAPIWFLAGLGIERYFPIIEKVGRFLAVSV